MSTPSKSFDASASNDGAWETSVITCLSAIASLSRDALTCASSAGDGVAARFPRRDHFVTVLAKNGDSIRANKKARTRSQESFLGASGL
ncbi:hypothetical protein AB7008_36230 [Bradyrhizobium sp. 521_C7_N1_3]|uniref:hypothetical protein n=1 Tax=Bradyrhizobium TaxID=374 RepID=UPI0027150AFA|nr:hypothetical protein [Bradyrhizobium japonicum]WLB56634.1 hypothetical protein QIH94_11795 [Bradyrhizobium japonicum]WLB61473.1 hypothetical protein QIH96_34010 [Bradyrhizobium japonicum]